MTPLASLPLVVGRQGTELVFQAALLAVRAGALAVGVHFGSDSLAMVCFGAGSGLYLAVYLFWLLRLVQVSVWPVFARLLRELLLAGVLLGGCRLLLWWTHGSLLVTGGALLPVVAYGAFRALAQIRQARGATSA